jgi:hypothetical protein
MLRHIAGICPLDPTLPLSGSQGGQGFAAEIWMRLKAKPNEAMPKVAEADVTQALH